MKIKIKITIHKDNYEDVKLIEDFIKSKLDKVNTKIDSDCYKATAYENVLDFINKMKNKPI